MSLIRIKNVVAREKIGIQLVVKEKVDIQIVVKEKISTTVLSVNNINIKLDTDILPT